MLSDMFKVGEVQGVLRKGSPARQAFDKNLYLAALGKAFPAVRIDFRGLIDVGDSQVSLGAVDLGTFGGMSIFQQLDEFADLATFVQEWHGTEWSWPTPSADPEAVKVAFYHFLEADDVWKVIREKVKGLRLPNGTAGASPEQLTAEQRRDPKSEVSGKPGAKKS